MIYAPAVRTGTDEEYRQAITEANEAAFRLSAADPARDMAITLAEEKIKAWTAANDTLLIPSQRSFHEGVRLLRDGDRHGAAIALDAAADHAARGTGPPRPTPSTADAPLRWRSPAASTLSTTPSTTRAPGLGEYWACWRLTTSPPHGNNIPVLMACGMSSSTAPQEATTSYAWLAAITAELRGEYDGGMAVGREEITRDARDLASRELAVKDLLAGFIRLPARQRLLDMTGERTVIWVSEVIDHDEQAIVSVVLRPGDIAPGSSRRSCGQRRGQSIMRRATAAQLSDSAAESADEIATLRQWIFRQEAVPARAVLIIPDRRL